MDQIPTAGTRVRIALAKGVIETGRVLRWRKAMGEPNALSGFVPVRFDSDGAELMVHCGALVVERGAQ